METASAKAYPTFALLNTEPRAHWETFNETLFMGSFMGGSGGSDSEIWSFFDVFDFRYPSEE